jgi:acetyl-CoA carboxylase carboxyltransferase component
MVKGRGSMALAGPHLVRAAIGEDVTQEELGGSRVHTRKSGVGDLEVDSDEACIQAIKDYLSFFPSHCEEPPPRREVSDPGRPRRRGAARRAAGDQPQAVRHVRRDPERGRRRRVVRPQGPVGEDDHHLPRADRRRPVGIVASQPRQLGGILDNDSADKAARFVNLCNAFGIPLVFLMDVPGFMVGTKVEAAGSSATGRRCSTRSPTRPSRRSRS